MSNKNSDNFDPNKSKSHTMKTRNDIKIKDSDIDFNQNFPIDKDDSNSILYSDDNTDTDNDNINDDNTDSESDSESNSSRSISDNNDNSNTDIFKRKINDLFKDENNIIIINNKNNKFNLKKRLKKIHDDDYDEEEDDEDEQQDADDIFASLTKEDDYNLEEEIKNEIKKTRDLIIKNKKYIDQNPNFKNYGKDEIDYFLKASKKDKKSIIKNEKKSNSVEKKTIPLRFKILNSNIDKKIKSVALKKIDMLNTMNERSSEYFKVYTYIENLCKIPCGIHKPIKVNNNSSPSQISNFLQSSFDILNNNIYGHDNSKEQIIRIIAQWISNPNLKGNCIGIHGSPGVGKTRLIKHGLCKALNLPFVFIPLGGVNDSAYLTGHSFTYEGAIHGKIVDSLMKANCMNPIIYFDELDKISDSYRGQEIINTLIHLTDSTQNDSFFDKYFYDIPLDLSKSLIVFTYNNDELINPILKDRMIRINATSYNIDDKINISRKFLIPELCEDFNFNIDDLLFTDDIIKYIVNKTHQEEGVRNLKRSLECIISNINLLRLVNLKKNNSDLDNKFPINNINIEYKVPFQINNNIVDTLIKTKFNTISDSIAHIYM